jgi:hypothetical protein
LLLLSLTTLLLVCVSSKCQAATAVARHLFHGHLIDDRLNQPPSGPASKSVSFPLSPCSSPNRCPLLRADRKSPRATVATEKCLHADRHLRPWNRPADAIVSTACAPNSSPSHEPVATTTERRSPRCSPLAALPPPWSTFYDEFLLSPPPKIRPPSRRHASRPFPPPPLTASHRNRPASPSPMRQWPGFPCLPCFTRGLAAQPRLGRPEVAQVHSGFSYFPIELI